MTGGVGASQGLAVPVTTIRSFHKIEDFAAAYSVHTYTAIAALTLIPSPANPGIQISPDGHDISVF